jgi:hypothetical protein
MEKDSITIEELCARIEKLTKKAWMAHADGREFEYHRVERDVNFLLNDLAELKINLSGHLLSLDQLTKIILSINHSNRAASRLGTQEAYSRLVQAFEPLVDKAIVLDTSNR